MKLHISLGTISVRDTSDTCNRALTKGKLFVSDKKEKKAVQASATAHKHHQGPGCPSFCPAIFSMWASSSESQSHGRKIPATL